MTLTRVFRWFPGWVRVETEGGYPERLLNEIARGQVSVWGVRRREEWTRFSCFAFDYRRLRRPARRACVRMRVTRKHGLPFLLHRYRHRKGLLVGAALYVALLALLAPRIWVIRVTGCTDADQAAILEQAAAVGVEIGKRMDAIDIKALEINGLSHLPELSFITVNPEGCVASVEVTERLPTPQVLDLSQPSDMVALRDGVVLSKTVVSGEDRVLVGEAVKAGTVLIAGRVETEVGEKLYRSYGQVWAQTERQITVSVPLVYRRLEVAEPVTVRPTLTFLCWDIPLYAPGPTAEGCLYRRQEHFLTADGMTLPLGITNEYYIPTRQVRAARTAAQARALATAELQQREQTLFAACEYTEVSRDEGVKGNAYTLTVHYRCRENIAVEVPLSSNPTGDG